MPFFYCIVLFFAIAHQFLFSLSLPIQDIRADRTISKKVHTILEGSVYIEYEMGKLYCDRAVIFRKESKNKENKNREEVQERAEFFGHVRLYCNDGSTIEADRGELFYSQREAIFYGSDSQKVLYIAGTKESQSQREETQNQPVKISGRKIIVKIAKNEDNNGPSLTDIRGEGSVVIEYPP